jgi:ABC-type multidrug transport system fused ATPase/permease subunit
MDAVSRELVRNRAMLTIMHRLINLEQHDEIIVLDGRRVLERGSHKRHAGTPACSRPA